MVKPQDIVLHFSQFKNILGNLPGLTQPISNQGLPMLNQVVTDKELLKAVEKLFIDGHHAQAVEKAFKYLNNLVKKTSGNITDDGSSLMKTVFSAKNPQIFLNAFSNQSENSEQLGYMEIMSGVMTGIRNPRAHEDDWEDSQETALALLSLANHLVIRVRNGRKANT